LGHIWLGSLLSPSNQAKFSENYVELIRDLIKKALVSMRKGQRNTFKGENAKVTSAFDPKLIRTATLRPLPLIRKGKISEIINQPIGPNDNCNNQVLRCE